jgi:ubiquinone/menaquinone biosynthesis C-methylase UbiE
MSAITRLGLSKYKPTAPVSEAQDQTGSAFGYQWGRRDSYESANVERFAREWLLRRYCSNDESVLSEWLSGSGKIIIDAGCGAGYSALALFGALLNEHDYLGVDISGAVDVARSRFAEQNVRGDFLRASFTDLPIQEAAVDIIFAEGVLHHTDNTAASLVYLSRFLKPGGKFLFYVYARKAPIREFTDARIRSWLAKYTDEEAWRQLYPLTKLGIELGKAAVTIEVPEDIPYLGITKGSYDLQRLFYWKICKAFYRPEFSFEEMNHLNYDWFRPLNNQTHTPEEVREMCERASLVIDRMAVEEAGITVVASKR